MSIRFCDIYNDMKTALITGITNQDGSYLAELLIKKNMVFTNYD